MKDESLQKYLEDRTVIIGGIWLLQNQLKRLEEGIGKLVEALEEQQKPKQKDNKYRKYFDDMFDNVMDKLDDIHESTFGPGRNQI